MVLSVMLACKRDTEAGGGERKGESVLFTATIASEKS